MNNESQATLAKIIVEAAGGFWIGFQESFTGHPIVVFHSESSGQPFTLPYDEFFTVNAVKEKLGGEDESKS